MIAHEQPDDLLDALGQLSTPLPAALRDARTRARCHDALARPRLRRARASDALLGVAVALYGMAILAEGLRVIGVI